MAAEEKRSSDLSDNDEDSGNDEPPYKEVAVNRPQPPFQMHQNNQGEQQAAQPQHVDDEAPSPPIPAPSAATLRSNDRIAIYENAFLNDRPNPQPPRNLRQYLNALTEGTHEANQNPIRQAIVNDVNNEVATAATTTTKPGTISALPVEVLLVIFSYLDDISLCGVGEVCKQWKTILYVSDRLKLIIIPLLSLIEIILLKLEKYTHLKRYGKEQRELGGHFTIR